RFEQPHTGPPPLQGILHDEDGIFCQQTDEHDHRYLHVNVVFDAHEVDEKHHAEYPKWDGGHYGQRQNIAFVLCRQQEEDEHEAHDEDDGELGARVFLLAGHARPFVGEVAWQHLTGGLFHGRYRIARAVPYIGLPVDGYGVVEVVPGYRFGTIYTVQCHHRVCCYHLALGILHINVVERRGVGTVRDIGLRNYAVEFPKSVEIRNEGTAEIDLHRLQEVADVYAQLLGFFIVDHELILRVVGRKGGEGKGNFLSLEQGGYQLLGHGVEPFQRPVAPILQHKFKAVHVAKSRHGREGVEHRFGPLHLRRHLLGEACRDSFIVFDGAAVVFGLGADDSRAIRGCIGIGNEVKPIHLVVV